MGLSLVSALLLQQDPNDAAAAAAAAGFASFFIGFWLVFLVLMLVAIVGMWKAFEKAGQPGWFAIIPIVNLYGMLQIAQRPTWWLILMFVPFVNLAVFIVVMLDIARHFGQGVLFAVGLFFLGFIFWPILGFGSAQYEG